MELPKYHETFIPVLKALNTEESLNSRELATRVWDNYYADLPQELLNKKTSSGSNVLIDRISWGKSYLKMGKFVAYPKRGMVQITEKGKRRLATGVLSLHDLKNDKDFLKYRASVESKKEDKVELVTVNVDTASPQDLIDAGFATIQIYKFLILNTNVKRIILKLSESYETYSLPIRQPLAA